MGPLRPFHPLLLFLLLAASAALAQSGDVAIFAGIHGGAAFTTSTGSDPELEDDDLFGVTFTLDRGRNRRLDVTWVHEESALLLEDLFQPPDATLVEVDIDYLNVGGRVLFRPGTPAQPYLGGTIGVTRLAAGGDASIRASAAFGAGIDLWASRRVGIRLDGRWWGTFGDAELELFCAGGCVGLASASGAHQLTASAGVVVRFGM